MWRTLAITMVAILSTAACAQTDYQGQPTPNAPSASRQQLLRLNHSATLVQKYQSRDLPDAPSYTPLSDAEKFHVFVETSQAPLTFMAAGVNTGMRRAAGSRMYGTGTLGFSKMYTAALATKQSNVFFGGFLFPKLLNQDPRYHPSNSSSMMPRAFYAASRVLMTRNDQGQPTVNSSYLLSTVVSSSLANAYKPQYYRSFSNTSGDILSAIGSEAGMNVLREFWPQLRGGLGKVEPGLIKRMRGKIHDKFTGEN